MTSNHTSISTDNELLFHQLQSTLQLKVPNAQLVEQALFQVPEITLALIEDCYPQAELNQSQIDNLMDSPPYWAFCWASGQVMARFLLDNPSLVEGRTVVDFGSGSGVVAIAAAKAGAKRAIALDIDPAALMASKLNASLNGITIETRQRLHNKEINLSSSLLLIADVFYDRDNIPMLSGFIQDYADVIVADSRVKPSELRGLSEIDRLSSSTVPDLGESSDFNSVGIFRVT
ncbi:50S ribosomal protein L11 methyltransferase [Arenicella sp. 4NH20-0111]|uniref:class I SAM-dependent methyltransferase n=1 Tax=Arenicella sp. 4NH20-0111 TaxID=3127648 RepID=UPI00310C51FC